MSTDKCVDREGMAHTSKGIPLSHKKEWSNAFLQPHGPLEIIVVSKISQKENDKCMISLRCGI